MCVWGGGGGGVGGAFTVYLVKPTGLVLKVWKSVKVEGSFEFLTLSLYKPI